MYSTSRKAQKQISIVDLAGMKRSREKITCLTAYDASFARVLDSAGIDIVLVGDSLGSVIQGRDSTVPVTMDDMAYHTKCVSNGCSRAFIVADLPFVSYSSPGRAVTNAARLMQEGNARMVKLEGGRQRVEIVKTLVSEGIPVCAHLGLLPQSINQLGSYRVQGKDSKTAQLILEDALVLQEAGASILVLECIPALLANEITQALKIPTIGIGAGANCDGQVLVLYDMLGISIGGSPKFSKNFMPDTGTVMDAVKAYAAAVRQGDFPKDEHSF